MTGSKVIGACLKAELGEAGMTAVELAERMGVTPNLIYAYISGRSYPSVPALIRIAEILGTTTDRLLGRKMVSVEDPTMIEVVYCKDCKKHNKGVDDVRYYGDACPFVRFRGRAQGHEFDYQWCVYREKKG